MGFRNQWAAGMMAIIFFVLAAILAVFMAGICGGLVAWLLTFLPVDWGTRMVEVCSVAFFVVIFPAAVGTTLPHIVRAYEEGQSRARTGR